MPPSSGRNIRLSLPRRFIGDLVHFAKQVPTVPVQRRMHLAEVSGARLLAQPRPSWCAVFTKAFALVAGARPELRRAYLAFPSPHLFEAGGNVASIAVERRIGEEDAVLFGRVTGPEQRSLAALDEKIRLFKQAPVEKVGSFKQALSISRLPLQLRRLVWWAGLNVSGKYRSQKLGTFGVSSYSGLGANSLHPLSPLTIALNYGPVESNGQVDVRLIYDHRVMDGSTVARALAEMEQVLEGEILAELREMRQAKVA
ncbi:MAG: hypothetical protein ACJ8FY_19870 [Gemmataceae bacterium]